MPFLEQYALSVRREPILVLESVAYMVEFMTIPGVKVKKPLRSKNFRRESFPLLPYCRWSSKAKISCRLTTLSIYNKKWREVWRILILITFPERSMGGKTSEDSIEIPSNLPSWFCQYIKKDGSICGKRCLREAGCVRHYKSPLKKRCVFCNELTYSQTDFCTVHAKPIYKKNWLERHEKK